MENAVPVRLLHAGVDVVTRVTQLRDLLGQELNALSGVAEDDALVDLELQNQKSITFSTKRSRTRSETLSNHEITLEKSVFKQ